MWHPNTVQAIMSSEVTGIIGIQTTGINGIRDINCGQKLMEYGILRPPFPPPPPTGPRDYYVIRCGCNALSSVFQLMKNFSVMPMDQHLTLNGVPLSDNEATLISLGIKPGSLLLLKVRLRAK